MNSPLQLFRDLLPFTNGHTEDKAAANVHSLLEATAGLPPQEVVVRLTSSVLPAAAGQSNLHMRFKLLKIFAMLPTRRYQCWKPTFRKPYSLYH